MDKLDKNTELLKDYFEKRDDILMAFVFGSYAKKQEISGSDFDVAVHFATERNNADYKKEDEMRSDIADIVKKEIDLVCLNKAPASLTSSIIKTGIPLVIKNKKLYWKIYLKVSLEAEDFWNFARDYFRIYKTAKSLAPEQKTMLLQRLQFLDSELKEIEKFKKTTFNEYQEDKTKRRNIERWAENIINAAIDISKIILSSERKRMPKTYENALRDFGILSGLNQEEIKRLPKFANLRNILAHEYLDILYERIQNFILEFPPLYKKMSDFLKKYI